MKQFSKRELEIIGLIAKGMRPKAIANQLGIMENTARAHARNIEEKLACLLTAIPKGGEKPNHVTVITHFALRHGLIKNLFDPSTSSTT